MFTTLSKSGPSFTFMVLTITSIVSHLDHGIVREVDHLESGEDEGSGGDCVQLDIVVVVMIIAVIKMMVVVIIMVAINMMVVVMVLVIDSISPGCGKG